MKIKTIVKSMLPKQIKDKIKSIVEKGNQKKMLMIRKECKAFRKENYLKGINLIGDIQAETGLGQSMRILAGMLDKSGIPLRILQMDVFKNLEHSDHSWDYKITEAVEYGINVIHINPGDWAKYYPWLMENGLNGRYNIAFWLWELEEFPEQWKVNIDTVDEIWAPSEFICRGIRKYTNKPVIKIPYCMDYIAVSLYSRKYFCLPENHFLFLMMYDSISVSERKNPMAVIRAFKEAFSPEQTAPGLIIKVNHLEKQQELKLLKSELKDYDHIFFMTNNMSRKEVESLIALADVYITLHRAEGFGLPAAEAMMSATPVISTNWSATTEFMDEESACLVNYKLLTLKKAIGPYPKGSVWAEADSTHAADYMRKLFHDKSYYEAHQRAGKRKVESLSDIGVDRIRERVNCIYEEDSIY